MYCARNLFKFSKKLTVTPPKTETVDGYISTALRGVTFQLKVILGKYVELFRDLLGTLL